MANEALSTTPDTLRPTTYLWSLMVAGPLLVLLDQLASYILVYWACASHNRLVLPLISVAAIVLESGLAWWSYQAYRERIGLAGEAPWRPFILLVSAVLAVGSAMIIVSMAIPRFVFDPCTR
jgi:hypothetical protein